jgi:hypothetical protein
MSHLDDDDLVLLHYGERGDPEAAAHAAACAECGARLRALGEELLAVVPADEPARPPDYGARVWARIEPRLEDAPQERGAASRLVVVRPFGRHLWRRVAGLSAIAAALVVAFLLGQRFPSRPQPISAEVRERVLLVAIGHHLERSQMILVELANAPTDGPLDVSLERASADELVAANRLYRQTAVRSGETALAAVLDELERVLVEVAAGPERLQPADLEELQRRIEARGLLFKIRVVGSQVRERGQVAVPTSARAS